MNESKKYFKLPNFDFMQDLNYARSILTHHVIQYHYGEHHRLYIEELNKLLVESELEKLSLEEIVVRSDGNLFNAASQTWNHCFYWLCLKPQEPFVDVEYFESIHHKIIENYNSIELFFKTFITTGKQHFGSGWIWLIDNIDSGKLEIKTTSNADNPITSGMKPILVCDLWEHAYYLDYHQKRAEYIEQFLKSVNWAFVEKNLLNSKIPNMSEFMQIDFH